MQLAEHQYQFLARQYDVGLYKEHEIKASTDAVVHYFTSYTTYINHCKILHPNKPEGASELFYDNCAKAYLDNARNLTHLPHYPIFGDLSQVKQSKD